MQVGMTDVRFAVPIKPLGNAPTNHPPVIIRELSSSNTMQVKLAVFLCILGLVTAAPGKQRPSRSLEEYLPPHHPQHTAPSKLKDYLPPDSAPIDLKASAEPCDCDEEPKGYFYPKPEKAFEMPVLRTLDQELPLEEEMEITTTEPPVTILPERPARSPKKSHLVTDPHDGPVRISTNFHVAKTDSNGRAIKFRRDTMQRSQLSKVDAVVVRPAQKKPKAEQKPKA